MTYQEQLNDPQWYAKREKIKLRDLNKCVKCGSQIKLNVHHIYYKSNLLAWEYPDNCYQTLCKNCHEKEHISQNPLSADLSIVCRKFGDKLFEENKKTSLYLDIVNRELLLSLNENTLKLFLLISFNLKTSEDFIVINETTYVRLLKLRNKKQLRENLDILVFKNILAKSENSEVYWVNPSILFCGNRVKKFPKNYKIR